MYLFHISFMLIMVLSGISYLFSNFFLLELNLILSNQASFSMIWIFDKFSLLFLFSLMIISFSVFKYSTVYLSSCINLKRFMITFYSFVISMVIMILGGNLFSSIIGWDGLGFSSFFLIIFFFSSLSFQASLLTYLINRLGDCLFIISILITFQMIASSNLASVSLPNSNVLILLIMVTTMTKTAQVPFSSWLPAAMAAPTPVSSLVHSSTLVTAGIYMLIRYQNIWILNENLKYLILIASSCTLLVASFSAMSENDLKKIVALSTLSQIGLIMFTLMNNLIELAFLHLIIHAFFKALLFMASGAIIHESCDKQDLRKLSLSITLSPSLSWVLVTSLLALSGWPFLSGFYSKDLIIDCLFSSKFSAIMGLMVYLSALTTVIYSIRMVSYLLVFSINWSNIQDMTLMSPMLFLLVMSNISGSLMIWWFDTFKFLINSLSVKLIVGFNIVVGIFLFSLGKSLKVNGYLLEFFESKAHMNMVSVVPCQAVVMNKSFLISSGLTRFSGKVSSFTRQSYNMFLAKQVVSMNLLELLLVHMLVLMCTVLL